MDSKKAIVITGASSGIGKACALHLDSLGFKVYAGVRKESDGESLIKQASSGLVPIILDVTDSDSITAASEIVERETDGSLYGLINNAGTNRVGPMEQQSPENIDLVIDLNIRALYRISQAAITPLKKAGGGSVVNMSSQMGHVGSPNRSLYCMSKHAVEGLSKTMAVELAETGIRVNTVAPTFVLTPMTKPMFEDREFSDFVMGMIPMKKLASAQEVANACVFLLSDLSSSTTGASLKVDGGWTAS